MTFRENPVTLFKYYANICVKNYCKNQIFVFSKRVSRGKMGS